MTIFTLALALLWAVRTARTALFYLYLWQLKEYRLDRFRDHFRTSQGKSLLFNVLLAAKLFLLLLFFFQSTIAAALVFLVYALEAGRAVQTLMRKRLLLPSLTKKTLVLTAAAMGGIAVLLAFALVAEGTLPLLLAFDILLPVFVSLLVLAFQPVTVFWKRKIIREAERKRKAHKNLKVVGITGSYGKTSTKEFLAHILSRRFAVFKTKEHQNSETGVSLAVLNDLKQEHEVFVCEMGAYTKGEIALLARVTQPSMAVLTGANEQHLATFGSKEHLMAAEGGEELVEALPEGAPVVVNAKSIWLREALPGYQNTYKRDYVLCSGSDWWAEDLRESRNSISFTVKSKAGESARFQVPLLGGYNTENLLLAVAAARAFGITLQEIAEAAETIPPEAGAMRARKGKMGIQVIDSTYSANPDGVLAGLEYLKTWTGRKALVMPSLIELGEASRKAHERIGKKIAEVCDLAVITTGEQLEALKRGAGGEEERVLFLQNAQEILSALSEFTGPDDAVLLEGGKESRVQRRVLSALTEQ